MYKRGKPNGLGVLATKKRKTEGMYVTSAQPVGSGRKSLGVFGVGEDGEPVSHFLPMQKEINYYVDSFSREARDSIASALGEEWSGRQLLQRVTFNNVLKGLEWLLVGSGRYRADDELHNVEFWAAPGPPMIYGEAGQRPGYCLKARFHVHVSPKTPNARRSARLRELVEAAFRMEGVTSLITTGEEDSPFAQTCLRARATGWWGVELNVAPMLEVGCMDMEWTQDRTITTISVAFYAHQEARRPGAIPPRVGEVCCHTSTVFGLVGCPPPCARPGGATTLVAAMGIVLAWVPPSSRWAERCLRVASPAFSSALAIATAWGSLHRCNTAIGRRSQCGVLHATEREGRRYDKVYLVPNDAECAVCWADCERAMVGVGLFVVGAWGELRRMDAIVNHGIHCDLKCLHERAAFFGLLCDKLTISTGAETECGVTGVAVVDTHSFLRKQLSSQSVREGIVSGRPISHVLSHRGGSGSLENISLHDLGVGKLGDFTAPLGCEQMRYCMRDAMLAFGVERTTMIIQQGLTQQANMFVYMDEAWRPNYPLGNTGCWKRSLCQSARKLGYVLPTNPRCTPGAGNTQGLVLRRPGGHKGVFELDLDKAYLSVICALNICPTTKRSAVHPTVGPAGGTHVGDITIPPNRSLVIHDGEMLGFDEGGCVECRVWPTQVAYARGCPAVMPGVFTESMAQMDVFQHAARVADREGRTAQATMARVSRSTLKVTNLAYVGIQAKAGAPNSDKESAASVYAATRWFMCEAVRYVKEHFATCTTCECTHFFDGDTVETHNGCTAPARGPPLPVAYVITDSVAHVASPGDALCEVAGWVAKVVNDRLFSQLSPIRLTTDKCMRWFVHFSYPWADSFIGVPCVPAGGRASASQWIRRGKMFNAKAQRTYWPSRIRAALAVAIFTDSLADEEEATSELRRCMQGWHTERHAEEEPARGVMRDTLELVGKVAGAIEVLPGEAMVDGQSVDMLTGVITEFWVE